MWPLWILILVNVHAVYSPRSQEEHCDLFLKYRNNVNIFPFRVNLQYEVIERLPGNTPSAASQPNLMKLNSLSSLPVVFVKPQHFCGFFSLINPVFHSENQWQFPYQCLMVYIRSPHCLIQTKPMFSQCLNKSIRGTLAFPTCVVLGLWYGLNWMVICMDIKSKCMNGNDKYEFWDDGFCAAP